MADNAMSTLYGAIDDRDRFEFSTLPEIRTGPLQAPRRFVHQRLLLVCPICMYIVHYTENSGMRKALSCAGLRVLLLTFLPTWLTKFVAACGISTFRGGLRRRTMAALGLTTYNMIIVQIS